MALQPPPLIRLKDRSDFLRAARGRKAARPGLVLQCWNRRDEAHGQGIRVGFTVTKKVGNAVVRNRIKRRLREVANEVLMSKGQDGHDYVLIGRKESLTRSYPELLEDLEKALQMISNHPRQNRRTKRPS